MNNREILTTNLRALMKHAGITTQSQLAQVSGISQTQIGNILNQKKSASIDLLERLAKAFGCERWLLLSPVKFLQDFQHTELEPLVHCYLRLSPNAQDAVWELIHQLYEANNVNHIGER